MNTPINKTNTDALRLARRQRKNFNHIKEEVDQEQLVGTIRRLGTLLELEATRNFDESLEGLHSYGWPPEEVDFEQVMNQLKVIGHECLELLFEYMFVNSLTGTGEGEGTSEGRIKRLLTGLTEKEELLQELILQLAVAPKSEANQRLNQKIAGRVSTVYDNTEKYGIKPGVYKFPYGIFQVADTKSLERNKNRKGEESQ